MDEREKEIIRIKKRMADLGYNQRSLSMKLFNKADRLRNLFEGKSKNMREDTYRAVMKELWPEEKSPVGNEQQIGMLKSIEMLILALLSRGLLPKEDLETLFNYQMRELRTRETPGAAEVLDQLLDFLHSKSFEKAPSYPAQSQLPLSDQSQKKKS